MRATIKLLTAIAVLLAMVVPTAEAATDLCSPAGGLCHQTLEFKPNHICYLPDVSREPDDVCELEISVVDGRYDPPLPMPALRPIPLWYEVLPVDGPPSGFVAVPGNYAIIAAGATGGVVPVQLIPDSPLTEEWAVVVIHYYLNSTVSDPPLVGEVLIRRP